MEGSVHEADLGLSLFGMAMSAPQFALACAAHTPLLMESQYADAPVCAAVEQGFASLSAFIKDFEPEQIIQFAPDHYHGFHYDLMPSFCVGAAARSYGDWRTKTGALNVDEAFALSLLEAVRESDIDAAISYDMVVDHGFVQIWEMMFGSFDALPIIPIFINAVAHPIPKYRRARQLGQAVGRFARVTGKRILFAASGGLSHDPVVPSIRGATAELRDRLIGRSLFGPEQQAKREAAVRVAASLAMVGEGPSRPLNPQWDRQFLDILRTRDWNAIDAFTPEAVDAVAGAGGNEVLAWVAAAAAMDAAADGYRVFREDYWPVPGWIAGLGLLSAVAA
jgi:2,3-dihydroxyphenylpropionate 1,2-dioxygenase